MEGATGQLWSRGARLSDARAHPAQRVDPPGRQPGRVDEGPRCPMTLIPWSRDPRILPPVRVWCEACQSDLTLAPTVGKTLLLHVNIRQYLHYFQAGRSDHYPSKIILLTPNEGLSHQHLEELHLEEQIELQNLVQLRDQIVSS